MKKNIFKNLYSSELTDRIAKYAPADDKLLAKSEKKLQDSKLSDDIQYEYEVKGVEQYRKRRLVPFVSLAVCGVLAAGIGGIYMLQTNKPDFMPGSSEQPETLQNLPPFGDISGLELKFGKGLLPIQNNMEDIPPERLFTVSPEQQSELLDILYSFSWGEPLNNDPRASSENYRFTMFFHREEGDHILRFYLWDNIIEWIYPETEMDGMPCYVGEYYQIDEALSSRIQNIIPVDTYVPDVPDVPDIPEYVMDDFEAIDDSRYLKHSYSSAQTFDMFDLNELDIMFMAEDSAPEYYNIPPEQKQQLAEYIANTEAWEDVSEKYDNQESGERIFMLLSDGGHGISNYASIVTFWSDGYITEWGTNSNDVIFYWWKTKPEMFDYIKTLTGTRQDSFTLSYSDPDEVIQNVYRDDDVLDEVFDRQDPPTLGIAYDSLLAMIDSHFAVEVPKDKQQALADTMDNAVWREIDKDTPEPDGFRTSLYVRDFGKPYVLHFYDNNFVMWDNGKQQRKFRTFEDLSLLLNDAVSDPELYENGEHMTYIEQTDNLIVDIWKYVDEADAAVEIPTY